MHSSNCSVGIIKCLPFESGFISLLLLRLSFSPINIGFNVDSVNVAHYENSIQKPLHKGWCLGHMKLLGEKYTPQMGFS